MQELKELAVWDRLPSSMSHPPRLQKPNQGQRDQPVAKMRAHLLLRRLTSVLLDGRAAPEKTSKEARRRSLAVPVFSHSWSSLNRDQRRTKWGRPEANPPPGSGAGSLSLDFDTLR